MTRHAITWAMEPLIAQLLYVFLAIVCLVTLVRSAMLARALFRGPGRQRISLERVIGRQDAERLAESALAGAIRPGGTDVAPPAASRDALARLLRLADARFEHGWHIALARVQATKGLSRLAVMAALVVICIDAYPTFFYPHWFANQSVYDAFLTGLNVLLLRLALGLAVGIVVGATAGFFEGCLIRRKAS